MIAPKRLAIDQKIATAMAADLPESDRRKCLALTRGHDRRRFLGLRWASPRSNHPTRELQLQVDAWKLARLPCKEHEINRERFAFKVRACAVVSNSFLGSLRCRRPAVSVRKYKQFACIVDTTKNLVVWARPRFQTIEYLLLYRFWKGLA